MLSRRLAAVAALALSLTAQAQTETLLDETATVVAPTAPSAVLRQFEILYAGSYELTVTDLAVPNELSAERAAVLRDGVIVRQLELGDAASATASFEATPGTYSLTIVGTPGAAGVGTIGARIRRGSEAPALELSETIAVPNPAPPATRQVLDTTIAIADAAQYRVTLKDVGFPGPLAAARLTLVPEGGAPVVDITTSGNASFNSAPGNYRLFALVDADATQGAGVFHVEVRSVNSDAVIYQRLVPVGRVEQLGGGALIAGLHTITATDLQLPEALPTLKLAVTSQGQLVSRLDAAGTLDFTAAAGGHELLVAAAPSSATSGSYAAQLSRGGSTILSYVNTISDSSAVGANAFTGNVPAAGSYRLRLTDFVFPQGFSALRATVTQGGVSLTTLSAPGSTDVNLQVGQVRVLVFGQANQTGSGLYGVELHANAGGAVVIEANQGVGTAFDSRRFTVNNAGRYQVFADDLEFPQRFAGLDAVITRGSDVIGSFFGGGSFVFSATPGNYFINFIAKPGAQSGGAGTWRMRVAAAPNPPSVTLSADSSTVSAGGTTRLQWTATGATQCSAAGAWSGSKAASGSETSVALSSQSTFNLECIGPGGSSSAQVVVSVSSPNAAKSGKGGGGRIDFLSLLGLLAAVAVTLSARAPTALRR